MAGSVSTAGSNAWEKGLTDSHIREALAAPHVLAPMRLLASVRPHVDGQGASLDEALAAIGVLTAVRPFSHMNAIVADQIAPPAKSLDTIGLGTAKGP